MASGAVAKNSFCVSTDSCVDLFRDTLEKHKVHCLIMKRAQDGKEYAELFNSEKEYDTFYEALKKGAKPTTIALNPFEHEEHFKKILETEAQGDIIHIPLSSGLSVTYENACKAAAEMNKTLKNRQIYVIDSLIASLGMAVLVEELAQLRDAGKTTAEAIKRIEQLRDNLQSWIVVGDLFHLKRGGRISGVKATIGTILNIKPIIVVNRKGKLVIENKMRGNVNAINYVLSKIENLGAKVKQDFFEQTLYFVRTNENQLYDDLIAAAKKKFPELKIKRGIIEPIIGTHVGCGTAVLFFEGARRLDINDK